MYHPFFFSTPAQLHPVRTCSRPHPAKILHLFIAVNEPKFQPRSGDLFLSRERVRPES